MAKTESQSESSHEAEAAKVTELLKKLVQEGKLTTSDQTVILPKKGTKLKPCTSCYYFSTSLRGENVCLHEESLRHNPIKDSYYRTAEEMRGSVNLCGPEGFFFKKYKRPFLWWGLPVHTRVEIIIGVIALLGLIMAYTH